MKILITFFKMFKIAMITDLITVLFLKKLKVILLKENVPHDGYA